MDRARVFRKLAQVPSDVQERTHAESDKSLQVKKRPKTRSVTTSAEKEKAVREPENCFLSRIDSKRSSSSASAISET